MLDIPMRGYMKIDYPIYINKPLYITVACITIGYDYRKDNLCVNVSDYIKLSNWLEVEIDRDIEKLFSSLPLRGRGNSLSFVLSRLLECNENYITAHIDFYKTNTYKELFNDFQIYKAYNSL